MTMGLGMALMEESRHGPRVRRLPQRTTSPSTTCPACADVRDIDAHLDRGATTPHLNPMGIKGIGEIGITGTAAAIANAVCHATGVRVRDLPIHLEDLLPD